MKKASAEGQMSEDSMASIKIMYLNKDIDSEEGQGLKPAGVSFGLFTTAAMLLFISHTVSHCATT